MPLDTLGIAVLGLDHWYTAFGVLDTAAASQRAPLVGIWDADAARRDDVRAKYPRAVVAEDPNALIGRSDVRLVAVCAATNDAVPLVKRALAAGKHVLSVKPAARGLDELDGVLQAAETARREHGAFFGSFEGMQRLHPRAVLLRDLVRSGAIGQPLSYHQVGHGSLPRAWPGAAEGASWWLDPARVPGGAWIDHALYAVDLARFVFGGEIDRAMGLIENRVHANMGVEDYGVALLRLAQENAPAAVSLIFEDTWAAGPGGGASRQQIIGTQETIRAEGSAWVVTKSGEETRHAIPDAPFFQLDALADLLLAGTTPPFGAHDARANLAACLRVYAAPAAA